MADLERAAKRQRKMPDLQIDTSTTQRPDMIVEVCATGDTALVVQGIAGVTKPQVSSTTRSDCSADEGNSVGIRVSSAALCVASPVFRRLLAADESVALPTPSPGTEEPREPRHIHLANDDGDALFLLVNILHLRNDALPNKIQPDLLFRFVAICARYECIIAAGRAASQWLDYIYTKIVKAGKTSRRTSSTPSIPPTPASAIAPPPTTPFSATSPATDSQTLFKLIEAALILNDALYFSRFTTHFILTQPPIASPTTLTTSPLQHRLAATLQARQTQAIQDLRLDFDLLIDPLAEALSEDAKHYHDCAPGDEPHPDELVNGREAQTCAVDKDCAMEFLAALRDANLWPATRWNVLAASSFSSLAAPGSPTNPSSAPNASLPGTLISALAAFRVPDYDASDACYWCSRVEDKFATALGLVKLLHGDRLWGLCLDCYVAGGVNDKGECRYEHYKVGVSSGGGVGGGEVTRAGGDDEEGSNVQMSGNAATAMGGESNGIGHVRKRRAESDGDGSMESSTG